MFSDGDEEETQDFATLLDGHYEFNEPIRGDIREAEILEIRETEIVVDLGAKRDGIVPSQDIERMGQEMFESLKVGDTVPVYVLNPSDRDGNLLVSINLGLQGQDWEKARKLLDSGDIIEAEVVNYNKGGLLVNFGRLEGFVPASHVFELQQGLTGQRRRDVMKDLIGQQIALKVIEVNQSRRRLILSQREAQREWRTQQKQRLLENLKVGDIVSGRVTGIRDFGVFVDLGGADGLIHVSELAWHRVPHPSDVVSIGDEIKVYVLELDLEHQRIALSLCRSLPDPWDLVEQTYEIGQVVEGLVSNVVDFGAFVVLDDGIEGLLHISEMADGTLVEPYSYIQRGDMVTVRIVRIEPERKRIGFSQLGLEPVEEAVAAEEGIQPDSVREEGPPEEAPVEAAAEAPPEPDVEEAPVETAAEVPEEPSAEEAADEAAAEVPEEPSAEEAVDEAAAEALAEPDVEEAADEAAAEALEEPDVEETADEAAAEVLEEPTAEEAADEAAAETPVEPDVEEAVDEDVAEVPEEPSAEEAAAESPEEPDVEEAPGEDVAEVSEEPSAEEAADEVAAETPPESAAGEAPEPSQEEAEEEGNSQAT